MLERGRNPGVMMFTAWVLLSTVATPPAAAALLADESAPSSRPGAFRLRTAYFTPYLHIGNLGLDTNVFYTATDRQTDFSASGGPGLEIVRPLDPKANSRIRLDGAVDYLYFARTESQRRLNGHGSALLELHGVKTDVVAEERYSQSFSRPSYQVDARLQQEIEGTRGLLRRRIAERFQLALFGERSKTRADSQEYLGTDLQTTLSEDRYQAGGELRMALTVKTQLVGGGEETWHRFTYLPARDGQSTLAFGGFRTDETALISGQALAGMRWFKLDAGGSRSAAYVDVEANWSWSPKTRLGARFNRDLQYSVFSTSGATPTNLYETGELFLDKMLTRTIYLRLSGRLTRLRSDGVVTIVTPVEGAVEAVRDDTVRDVGGELGYQFRSRVRIGVSARYTTRTSSFDTLGIRGLLGGLTVTYNPPQPRFR